MSRRLELHANRSRRRQGESPFPHIAARHDRGADTGGGWTEVGENQLLILHVSRPGQRTSRAIL